MDCITQHLGHKNGILNRKISHKIEKVKLIIQERRRLQQVIDIAQSEAANVIEDPYHSGHTLLTITIGNHSENPISMFKNNFLSSTIRFSNQPCTALKATPTSSYQSTTDDILVAQHSLVLHCHGQVY